MENQKFALITGASEGIGHEFALRLAEEGYVLTLVARNEKRLNELLETLKIDQEAHRAIVADLSTKAGCDAIANTLSTNRFHLLVNNAGRGAYGSFQNGSYADYESVMHLNCDSLVRLSHVFLAQSQKGDALLNVASVLAYLPLPGSSIYAATKAFVASFSQSLWYEQKSRDVYVMCLCPGATESEFHKRAGGDLKKKPPRAITRTVQVVVQVAIHALRNRSKPVIVSGSQNKIAILLARLLPHRFFVNILGQSS